MPPAGVLFSPSVASPLLTRRVGEVTLHALHCCPEQLSECFGRNIQRGSSRRARRRRGGEAAPHWSAGPVESDHCHANLALPLVSWQLPCGELGVAEKDVMPGKATKDPKRHPPGVGNCWMLPSSSNQDGRLTAALLGLLQLRCPLFVATLLEIPAQRSVPGLKRRPLPVPAFAARVGAHCDLLALVGAHPSFGSGRVCLLAGHLCSSSIPEAFSSHRSQLDLFNPVQTFVSEIRALCLQWWL